ncbi:hypothetical protein IQK56_13335 [Pseudomonas sp. MAFF 301449]|uniref:EF-hand domain-containing protein n=1 Tax=Pseudomonas cyclaminis TaxID=2781239 RepID=A0ABR9SSD2_9PSED|nr:hypothetical protein [Pseudomonas cyclaminis]MBE8591839.1 hypothetical protein [Pseudomonas cyclaminis]MBE8602582.1 hypothetical protein [Pseudomonas cyclaminis]
MDLCFRQQPRFQPAASTGLCLVNNSQLNQMGNTGYNNGGNMPASEVARGFSANFDYFRTPGTPFVSRETLGCMAERPLIGDRYHDPMTLMARAIRNNPDMENQLDAINHRGDKDGLISQGDVSAVIQHFDAQEAALSNPPRGGGAPLRSQGAMQQQRLNQLFFPAHSSQSPRYDDRAYVQPQPPFAGVYSSQDGGPGSKPYAGEGKEDFSNKILSHFSSLEDPNQPGAITDRSLNAVAAGRRLDGQPATQDEMDIAKELLSRGGLFKELDQGKTGKLDGSFTRDDLGYVSENAVEMSQLEILQNIKKHFSAYGDGDDYVNLNEMKEAAGLVPSEKTFTPEQRITAIKFLQDKELRDETDVGVDDKGGAGYKDGRFDMDNVNHMIKKKSKAGAET